MKKIYFLLVTVLSIAFISCTGDSGPPGPPGPPGNDGLNGESAIAFEINGNFTTNNNFELQHFFDFEVFPNEVILIYRLWGITEDDLDIWRQLPQTVIFEDGSDLVYNFDFTLEDLIIFLESTSDLATLGPIWTQDQIFRVIVVPADILNNIDVSNINNVIELGNITHFEKF